MQPPIYKYKQLTPIGKNIVVVSIERPITCLVEVDIPGVEIVTSHNVCRLSAINGLLAHCAQLVLESAPGAYQISSFRI